MDTRTTHSLPADESRLERLLGYVAQDSANPQLLADAFALALATGRHATAEQLASLARAVPVPTPALHAQLCLHALQAQRWADALAHGVAAVGSGCDGESSLANTACAAAYCGDHRLARDLLLRAWPKPADMPRDELLLLARAHYQLGDRRDALALLAHEGFASDADALGLRALIAGDDDDDDTALRDARASLALDPAQPDALLALADALRGLDCHDESLAAANALVAVMPSNGRGWSSLAQAHLARLSPVDAARCATEAVRHMPGHLGTWHVLGWSRLLAGDTAGARDAFNSALALSRSDADSHGGLAAVDAAEGRHADAERRLRVVARLDPSSLAGRYAQVLMLLQSQRNSEARALIDSTLAQPFPGGRDSGAALAARRLRDYLARHAQH